MAVEYKPTLFGLPAQRPLARTLDRMALLRQSNVNFIPYDNRSRTIRTQPLLEDTTMSWKERYIEAAMIYLTNPYCFAAQTVINDEVADGRVIIEEKQGSLWKEHTTNTLAEWIKYPNPSMDIKEFFRAYATHLHTFGSVQALMLQPGDILANGKVNLEPNCFDIIFPGRLAEDRVSDPYKYLWYYMPVGYEEPFKIANESLFMDVLYNPAAHSLGVSLPNNPLNQIFKIHRLFMRTIERFFDSDAIPKYILTRIIDMQKEASAMSLTDDEIEESLQRIYSRLGRGGPRDGGWLGLRGDWKVNRIGSPLPELFQDKLFTYLESVVSAVYGVPSSLFWVGMQSSNQRASRQQDSIDFFNRKIKPLQERICQRLSAFLVPKFLGEQYKGTFRIHVDVSEMALAQYAVMRQYRMYERWWQMRTIKLGQFLNYVNEPTDAYTAEELDSFYEGGTALGLNVGKGEQDTEDNNGLE